MFKVVDEREKKCIVQLGSLSPGDYFEEGSGLLGMVLPYFFDDPRNPNPDPHGKTSIWRPEGLFGTWGWSHLMVLPVNAKLVISDYTEES